MVVKIQPPSEKVEATILYNERKADGPEGIRKENEPDRDEDGHVVATVNVPPDSTLEDEFDRLKLLNTKKTRGRNLEKAAFHMSVNPGAGDTPLTEKQVVALVDEMMKKLGYGDSPYRIYKHTDIEREHYHVVSTRIGQDGKKINDSFENKRINKIAEELAEKYGYTVGLEVPEVMAEEDLAPEEVSETSPSVKPSASEAAPEPHTPSPEPVHADGGRKEPEGKPYVPPFSRDSATAVSEQFRAIHKEVMTWSFSTPEQYKAIMKWRYNVEVKELDDGVHFVGLHKGKGATPPVSEGELGMSASKDILDRCTEVKPKSLKSQRKRIEGYAEKAMADCPSLKEFRRRMSAKGIYVVLSFTEDGQPFGVTWLDRATKTAFKGSETSCTLPWLKEKAESNGWAIRREHGFDKTSGIKAGTPRKPGTKPETPRYRIDNQVQQDRGPSIRSAVKKMLKNKSKRAEGNSSKKDKDDNSVKV